MKRQKTAPLSLSRSLSANREWTEDDKALFQQAVLNQTEPSAEKEQQNQKKEEKEEHCADELHLEKDKRSSLLLEPDLSDEEQERAFSGDTWTWMSFGPAPELACKQNEKLAESLHRLSSKTVLNHFFFVTKKKKTRFLQVVS
jgi:hypothetical protein